MGRDGKEGGIGGAGRKRMGRERGMLGGRGRKRGEGWRWGLDGRGGDGKGKGKR